MNHEDGDVARTGPPGEEAASVSRRGFLGYLIAAPVLAIGVKLGVDIADPRAATASVLPGAAPKVLPTLPGPADFIDLGDLLIDAALPTSNILTLTINKNGIVDFLLPRDEVGQGITTSIAMIIADELDVPLSHVNVKLQPAAPELLFAQLTGGSNTIRSLYPPVRSACALAKGRLLAAAAEQLSIPISQLTIAGGTITSSAGHVRSYGSLSAAASNPKLKASPAPLKAASARTLIGTPTKRIDARAMVTGQKRYTLDLHSTDLGGIHPMPTMIRRPPTINGTVVGVHNKSAVKAMPGVIDVATIPTGVAVMALTFGQCIDAVDALEVTWGPGTVDHESNATVARQLRDASIPMTVAPLPLLSKSIEAKFDWAWASHAPMETNCAIADVRHNKATIWSSCKSPIVALQEIALAVDLPQSAVTFNVIQGGGSFGRKLFYDAALEAAQISKAMAKPVKLMWHRTDDIRHGRMHPQSFQHVRATYGAGEVVSFEHHVASVETDLRHGLGEVLTAESTMLDPIGLGAEGFAQTVFLTTINCPYNFGVVDQVLAREIMPDKFHTASMRSVYSYSTRGVEEIVVDELAHAMGHDPVAFRLAYLKDQRYKDVVSAVAKAGEWGKKMLPGTAQGIGFHFEYRSCTACLVEIDTNNIDHFGRKIPRVTRATIAVDAGLPINPMGLQAAMISGLTDGISYTLTAGVHIVDGTPQEGSYAEYHYARQYQSPQQVEVIVMPATTGDPGGSGELGVPAAVGAVANAYARATGKKPRSFPLYNPSYSSDLGTAALPPSLVPDEPTMPKNSTYPLPSS